MKDTKLKLSPLTVFLHWLVAFGVIALLFVGFYMDVSGDKSLMPTHKSVGTLLFLFIMARVVWRWVNGWLVPLKDDDAKELLVARIVTWTLLLGSVLMPLSGMFMGIGSGRGLYMFGMELIAATPDLANPGKYIAVSKTLAGIGHEVHEILAWVLAIATAAHIAGALKHHIVYKNQTLLRIKGKQVSE